MNDLRILSVVLFCAVCWSCSGEVPQNNEPNNKPPETRSVDSALTYYKDVKPILNRSCVGCHQTGGIGPWDLSSYDKLKGITALIAQEVKSKRMPPWQPANGCQEYVGNSSLSEKEIKTITDWVEAGAPKGDPTDDQSKPPFTPAGISRVDLTLKMKAPYSQYKTPDDYRCFVVDWPIKEKAYVTGAQVIPGNTAVAHHIIVVAVGPSELEKLAKLEAQDPLPGYSCYGSPGPGLRAVNLGNWVPGAQQVDFPKGSGIPVEPGSKVIIQVHYNVLTDNPKPDQTSINLKIDKQVEKNYRMIPITNPRWALAKTMKIPAGASETTHSFSYDPNTGFFGRSITKGKEVNIHTVALHMHQRGKSGKVWLKRKDGSKVCLLHIPRWDFNWQGLYRFIKPITLKPGDQVGIECKWDNSPGNQPLIGGKRLKPVDLNWGDGTQDEMCLSTLNFTEK